MRIVVCAKQVLDPDAVNNYALWGQLKLDQERKTLAGGGIPLLMNAYDAQAIEAAARIWDAGVECSITVITVGDERARDLLKQAAALGANQIVLVNDPALRDGDGSVVAVVLARAIEKAGGADLVLCGRQASDDDQGVVPMLLAELLDMPAVTIARDVQVLGDAVRVVRVTSDGDEVVEADLPALVTVSNELGEPRYPKMADLMAARRKAATVWNLGDLEMYAVALAAGPQVRVVDLFVPEVQGKCEFIAGTTAEDLAAKLLATLRREHLIQALEPN